MIKEHRPTPRQASNGAGKVWCLLFRLVARFRPVANGPKAPYGRFRAMPPRRALFGEIKVGTFE